MRINKKKLKKWVLWKRNTYICLEKIMETKLKWDLRFLLNVVGLVYLEMVTLSHYLLVLSQSRMTFLPGTQKVNCCWLHFSIAITKSGNWGFQTLKTTQRPHKTRLMSYISCIYLPKSYDNFKWETDRDSQKQSWHFQQLFFMCLMVLFKFIHWPG